MNELDLKLYELLGDKTLSFGCWVRNGEQYVRLLGAPTCNLIVTEYMLGFTKDLREVEIIGHEPTIADLHKWFDGNEIDWEQRMGYICAFSEYLHPDDGGGFESWKFTEYYDSSLPLLQQSDITKQAIIELISSHSKIGVVSIWGNHYQNIPRKN